MDERRLSVKKIREFMAAELFFGLLLFLRYYEAWVNLMNGTVLAFSYKYGFISRGLVGTFYQWLDRVLPFDMMRYQAVVNYTLIVTMIFYGVMAGFLVLCLRRGAGQIRYIILFFTIFMVPFSAAHFNFGRPDVYCLMLSTLAAVLLIKERAQWLVVPIAAVGVMIHQGNVFMYLNIILVLLLYRIFSSSGKRRRYYVILLIASFLVASALFLWFELFSHGGGQAIYDEVVETARHLTRKGNIHEDLVDKEILGIDLTDREVEDHRANFVQFAFFALMMLPYIFFLVRFFRGLIRGAATAADRWKYVFVALGAGTMLPDMLLKIDYGRWMFAIIAYYCVMLLALHAMGDVCVRDAFARTLERVKTRPFPALVMLMYPLAFQPFEDVSINSVTEGLADLVNEGLHLGWW